MSIRKNVAIDFTLLIFKDINTVRFVYKIRKVYLQNMTHSQKEERKNFKNRKPGDGLLGYGIILLVLAVLLAFSTGVVSPAAKFFGFAGVLCLVGYGIVRGVRRD